MSIAPKTWKGAAAVIVAEGRMLMVKTKSWSIPSGGIEKGETPEQARIREVWEETGFKAAIKKSLPIKEAFIENYDVTTYYFLCEVVDGEILYHDPDDAIEEIAWKSAGEIVDMQHDYPEDLELLLSFMVKNALEEV